MRWSKFKDKDARGLYDIISQEVFPLIKSLKGDNDKSAFSRHMKDTMFLFSEKKKQLLQKVITGLDDLYTHDIKDQDMLGDIYCKIIIKIGGTVCVLR